MERFQNLVLQAEVVLCRLSKVVGEESGTRVDLQTDEECVALLTRPRDPEQPCSANRLFNDKQLGQGEVHEADDD